MRGDRIRPARRGRRWRRPNDSLPYADAHVRLPDGRRLAYAEFGDPEGRPVFWFPGTPGARTQIPPEAPRLGRQRGFRIIGVDRPGFGGSTPHPRRTLMSWTEDIRTLADRLGIERFACVGLSGGGPYVMACAYALPERMVAGVSLGGVGPLDGAEGAPGLRAPLGELARVAGRLRRPLAASLGVAARAAAPFAGVAYDLWVALGPTEGDREIMRRRDLKHVFLEDTLMGIRRGVRGPVWDISLFARRWGFSPRDIRIPIRLWHGDVDPIVPLSHSQHLAGLIPDAKLVEVPGLGHFAGFVSTPDVLSELEQVWDAPSHPGHSARRRPGEG